MNLQLQSQTDSLVTIKVCGKLTQRNVTSEKDPLVEMIHVDGFGKRVLFDLSEVELLDSSGINWLLTSQRRLRESGGRMVLHSLSPIARNVIRVLNMQTVFAVAENEAQAQELVQGATP